MVFKNEEQLKKFLLEKCQVALSNAQEQIYQIIDRFLKAFYADYDPLIYQRTEQLLHSLVKSDVRLIGNNVKAEVYFDINSLNYETGRKPSGKQVMDAAAEGWHGADGLRVVTGNSGVSVWNDPKQIIDAKAINILKNMLIAEGISIK